jgi:hypothetical protein
MSIYVSSPLEGVKSMLSEELEMFSGGMLLKCQSSANERRV